MKKTVSILILGTLPVLALAAGEHSGDHHSGGDGSQARHGAHGHGTAQPHGNAYSSAAGRPGDPAKVSRTIDMTMDDTMRFTPSQITVKAGETVRIFAKNTGKVAHELVLGSLQELQEHAEMMRRMPDMKHVEPNQITLAPGQRGGIVWQFDQAGTVDFGCLIPGHMEAGMVGKVQVD